MVVQNINFGLTLNVTGNGFIIGNEFIWPDSDSTTKTTYANVTVIEEENKITVERSLEFNNQVFVAHTVSAANYMELYTLVYGGFDFWFDALANSTQIKQKRDYTFDYQSYYGPMADVLIDFVDYQFVSMDEKIASLVFTSVNNKLIKVILQKIEETHQNIGEKLVVNSKDASLKVFNPIHFADKEWFLTRWCKENYFLSDSRDEILWLDENPIGMMSVFVDFYAGKCEPVNNPDFKVTGAARNAWNTLKNDETMTITIEG